MAGAVGKVLNRSGFASFVVKDWQPWMTEAVILHVSGMSIPELRVKFNRTDTHLRNIISTDQANEIIRKLQSNVIQKSIADAPARISLMRERALTNMEQVLEDADGKLKSISPFAFLEANRKVYETLSKHDAPVPAAPHSVTNIQQNTIIGNSDPSMLARLRDSVQTPLLEVPRNVEYLGSPPPREIAGELFTGRVLTLESKGED
jgi:hypothetical protein